VPRAPPARERGEHRRRDPVDGVDLLALDERAMNAYRGTRIAMIFQDPMTALNRLFTVGNAL
jgi:ABC-type microcin C transport system duplicated ATPase subunit YejF